MFSYGVSWGVLCKQEDNVDDWIIIQFQTFHGFSWVSYVSSHLFYNLIYGFYFLLYLFVFKINNWTHQQYLNEMIKNLFQFNGILNLFILKYQIYLYI